MPTCADTLAACELFANKARDQVRAQEVYIEAIEKQRDRALGELKQQGGGYPFYFWVILGVAGGVVLTRGLK